MTKKTATYAWGRYRYTAWARTLLSLISGSHTLP